MVAAAESTVREGNAAICCSATSCTKGAAYLLCCSLGLRLLLLTALAHSFCLLNGSCYAVWCGAHRAKGKEQSNAITYARIRQKQT